MDDVLRWSIAFAATQVVEVPIYVYATRGRPWRSRIWIAFMASTITHPIAWALGFVLHPFAVHVLVAEAIAVGVEAWWLHRHGIERAFWWSLTANAASVAAFIGVRSLL